MIYWTGIGSRETPNSVCMSLSDIGYEIGRNPNFCLRSGAADGADTSFEWGNYLAIGYSEIYLPWKGFNKDSEQRHGLDNSDLYLDRFSNDIVFQAKEIAEKFHPKWRYLTHGAKLLHTRNVFQLLGRDLDKQSDFVVCWTKDGKASGGTGQALRIANHFKIPIFNVYNPLDYEMCLAHFKAMI